MDHDWWWWGVYDDENSIVQKCARLIEKGVLPKTLYNHNFFTKKYRVKKDQLDDKIRQLRETQDDAHIVVTHSKRAKKTVHLEVDTILSIQCRDDAVNYMTDNSHLVATAVKFLIQMDEKYNEDFIISGIALRLARGWLAIPSEPFDEQDDSHRRGYDFPVQLPPNFPEDLRIMAYNASMRQNEAPEKDIPSWNNLKYRKRALRDQIRLFSGEGFQSAVNLQ